MMTVLSFSASSSGEHEAGHWHSLAEFTESHAHFLRKTSLLICSITIGGKENGLGHSVSS